MPEFAVYASAPARLVKSVEAASPEAAIRKAKADIAGWYIADNDGISLEHMSNHFAEEVDQDVDYGQHANGHSPTTYTGNA